MNNTRRKKIKVIVHDLNLLADRIEELRDEEQEYIDNLPDNLQDSDNAVKAQAAVDNLEEAHEIAHNTIDAELIQLMDLLAAAAE